MNGGRVGAIAKRHWWVLKRSPHRSFDIVLWPIVDTLTFGSLAIAYQSDFALAALALPNFFTSSSSFPT